MQLSPLNWPYKVLTIFFSIISNSPQSSSDASRHSTNLSQTNSRLRHPYPELHGNSPGWQPPVNDTIIMYYEMCLLYHFCFICQLFKSSPGDNDKRTTLDVVRLSQPGVQETNPSFSSFIYILSHFCQCCFQAHPKMLFVATHKAFFICVIYRWLIIALYNSKKIQFTRII